jgi:diguanylate cyclase (GGDEF)-like protein
MELNTKLPSIRPLVIMIDDTTVYLESAKQIVQLWGYEVWTTSDPEAAIEKMHELTFPSIFLIDFCMPKMNGLQLMKKITSTSRLRHVCLLVTAEDDHDILTEVRANGGWGYFSKNPPRGGAEHNLGLLYQRELEKAIDILMLLSMAYKDPLTDLHNRRSMHESWDREWMHAKRERTTTSAVFIDFCKFKTINDSYGHDGGNRCLKSFGWLLSNTDFAKQHGLVRGLDISARLGGDEFVIILTNTHEAGAVEVVDRIWHGLEETPIAMPDGSEIHLQISVGVAELLPEELGDDREKSPSASLDLLIDRADAAMYEFKKGNPQPSLRHLKYADEEVIVSR